MTKNMTKNHYTKNILLIGAGNMGSAMGLALLKSGCIKAENFFVVNPSPEKLQKFSQKGCKTSHHAEDFIPQADIILLAIKPQILRNFLETMQRKNKFSGDQILLSIAAGISTSEIKKASGLSKIVRVMPNTPLLVEKGVSGYYFSPEISSSERLTITHLIQCFGLSIECDSEDKINAITALSGSGPAYFFRILESMSEQAEKFGFSKNEAEKISLHTLLGAGFLAEDYRNSSENSGNFTQLRKNVTSKGGTTEAALKYFEENNFSEIFQEGILKAKKRAEEL